jgi:hypothetical protein
VSRVVKIQVLTNVNELELIYVILMLLDKIFDIECKIVTYLRST